MDVEPIHELSAGYALNALDPQEERFYSRHLAHCVQCQADITYFADAVAALGYAAPAVELPPTLRQRILDAASAESIPARPRWRFRGPTAAAVCAVAASLTVWATGSDNNHAARLSSRTLPLSGAAGSIVRSPNGDATLIIAHLHVVPRGKTYEAWIIQNGTAVPAALFRGSAGKTAVHLTKRLPRGATVAVTIERGAGTAQLTKPPLFTSASA